MTDLENVIITFNFFRWRHIFWGIGLQFVFGLLVLRWDVGKAVFECLGNKVTTFLGFTDAGSGMVYGFLTTGFKIPDPNKINMTNPEEIQFIEYPGVFAFQTLSVIYFFSFFVSMLFYLGVLQWVVMKLGWLLSISVGTTAAESLNAAANIFLGQTEAPLLIKPFLSIMTK